MSVACLVVISLLFIDFNVTYSYRQMRNRAEREPNPNQILAEVKFSRRILSENLVAVTPSKPIPFPSLVVLTQIWNLILDERLRYGI